MNDGKKEFAVLDACLLLHGGPKREQVRRHRLPRLAQHVDELARARLVGLPAEEGVRDACAPNTQRVTRSAARARALSWPGHPAAHSRALRTSTPTASPLASLLHVL